MKNDFNMCPICGSKKIVNHNNRKWICQDCNFDLYCNVAAAVGIIIIDKNNNVLFEIRAKDPKKGYYALPGGFVDFNESAEEAVKRECYEEIGIAISDFDYLCSFPNTYVYKNIEYKTCDFFFIAKLPDKYENMEEFISTLKLEKSEVTEMKYCKVETLLDLEKIPLAFESAEKTLRLFVLRRTNNGTK